MATIVETQWAERILSNGLTLAVDRLVTLHIGNGDFYMFSVPIQEVRQITIGPRSDDAFPWNVDVAYQGAHFAFTCGQSDLAAVRFLFAGIPLVDMAARLGLPPAK